ncbi:LCP family protein [Paenibacillus sp. WQ 127069]|uniref:LCP family protein n=1 Tax=Paenibacillus baimaensis TaxID=2982185 RepID=A0ABT2UUJ9_9BACL|nr:LCP family protein [Paenibacillus sp. WQ 127069]MCU6797781.1 LCP family protein [Paenibacillus sp. WQ 127069]
MFNRLRGLLVFIVLGLGLIYWMIWTLHPDKHFTAKAFPLLAVPTSYTANHHPNDGSSYTFQLKHQNYAQQLVNTYMDTSAPTSSSPTSDPDLKSFNALLIGVDALGNENSRSDVILLVHVIPSAHKAVIISVPRDTQVHIAGIGNTKINHSHILGQAHGGSKGGTEAVIQAVSDLLQLPIHYYAKTNFTGFEHLIDSVGGVDVDVPHNMLISDSRILLRAGTQHLDGKQALSFVRERYSLEDGDFGRQVDQTLLIKAVVHKMLQPEHLSELPGLLAKVKDEVVETNFTDSDLISLAWLFKEIERDQISHIRVPGHPGMERDPLVGMPLWYWIPDSQQIREITRKLSQS